MTTMRLLPLTLASALLLGACAGSQPPVQFHTLMPPIDAVPAPTTPAKLALRIAPVRVPAQVDQPQWVLRTPDGGLQVLEQQRWAASPAEEWRAALADQLSHRLGALDFSRSTGAPPVGLPLWQLQVELQRFESVPGGEALQQATWSLRAPGSDAVTLSCNSLAREPAGPGYAALAAAHRAALARIADAIADALRTGAAHCPPPSAMPQR